MTLDFSNAMQLHDFNDMNAFPCNLRSLTVCLSEVIFMEGFMRKVYQSLSSLEVLHLIGIYRLFLVLSRVSKLTRDIDVAIRSVRLSVTFRYCMETA